MSTMLNVEDLRVQFPTRTGVVDAVRGRFLHPWP